MVGTQQQQQNEQDSVCSERAVGPSGKAIYPVSAAAVSV